MKKDYAKFLLEETRQNYNLIAEDYARTRAFIPADIKALGEYAFEKERILDSGCANGRLFEIFKEKDIDYFGIDFSEKLIEIARKRYLQPLEVFRQAEIQTVASGRPIQKFGRARAKFQVADALNLPFPSNFFDKVYSISVLHNIPSGEFRFKYLREIRRTLKPGGLLILRVWDFWKRKIALKLIFKYTFLKIIGKSQLDFKDVFVPWKKSKSEVLIERYFHCFIKKELEKMVKKAGFNKIKKCWREGKDPRTNIYLIAEK